jgi:hypothetical protein
VRAISANADAVLRGQRRSKVRIQVKDAGGTFRDLGSYAGANMVVSVDWHEGVDDPGITWEASVVRENELLSFVPLMQTSGLNRQFDISVAYAPLLQVGRQMKVEWAMQAEDDPSAPTFNLAFTGYLDTIEWSGDQLQLTGRGDEAKLIDTYIERERIYAFAQGLPPGFADRGCLVYTPSTAYAVGDRVLPTDAKRNDSFFRVTVAGTSAATEPTWPTTPFSFVISGGVRFDWSGATSTSAGTPVETIMQQILDDNGLAAVVLSTPVSPAWAIRWFMVGRQPLFDELRLLADQLGWAIRYRFDAGSGTMKLTLYDPLRGNVTSARTFAIVEVDKIRSAKIQVFDIRNAVQVVYSDSQDLDSSGFPKRKTIAVTNGASITKYGRRFAEIAEGSSSNIDTSAEATILANAVLDDLREPEADLEADVPLFPFAETTDLYTLAANGVHFDTDQKLAVVGYSHSHSAGDSLTTIRLRGRPSTGSTKWLQRCTDAYNGELHAVTMLANTDPILLTADVKPVGGARITLGWKGGKGNPDVSHELHISTIAGFAPSPATLVASGRERSFEVGDLDPAKPHYGVVVPISFNNSKPVRGQPSEQLTFTPGRGVSTQLNPNVEWGRLPLNGGFETSFDPADPPDFWFIQGGAWGSQLTLGTTGGISGAQYVKLKSPPGAPFAAAIYSAEFTANELQYYAASFWRKTVSGAGVCAIGIFWYDLDHVSLGNTVDFFNLTDQVGAWVRTRTAAALPPVGTRFARLSLAIVGTAANEEVHLDNVEFDVDERRHVVGAAGEVPFAGTWAAFGGGYQVPQFYRDRDGMVTIEGFAADPAPPLPIPPSPGLIFTLPVGYRPGFLKHVYQIVVSNNAVGVVEVLSTGDVLVQLGSSIHVSLWGIRFPAGA